MKKTPELQLLEARYRNLFETAKDGVLLIDSKTEKIIDANPHLLGVLGYSLDEIVGKKFWEIGTFRDIESAKVLFKELQIKGSIRHEDLPLLTKDGREIEVEFVSSTYSVGTLKTIQCNIRDITERRKIENTMATARKDAEEFTYSVSHDLRAPLRAIDGFSKILVEDYTSKLDDEGRRIISVIGQSIDLMERLIDDLLVLSRTGSQPVTTEEIKMGEMAKDVFEELKRSELGRKITINLEVLPRAKVDPILMRQVWANLLSNAIKFTRSREEAIIDVRCKTENNMVVYSVKDNGVGFNMKYVDKLFQIFQRLHTRGEYEGTGVGLAITRRIIQRHDGKVWAEGKVDEGATFYFALPARH